MSQVKHDAYIIGHLPDFHSAEGVFEETVSPCCLSQFHIFHPKLDAYVDIVLAQEKSADERNRRGDTCHQLWTPDAAHKFASLYREAAP